MNYGIRQGTTEHARMTTYHMAFGRLGVYSTTQGYPSKALGEPGTVILLRFTGPAYVFYSNSLCIYNEIIILPEARIRYSQWYYLYSSWLRVPKCLC